MNAGFVIRLAWREIRARPGRLAVHAGAIAAGVAALVAVLAIKNQLVSAFDAQARQLLAADLVVSSRRTIPETAEARVTESARTVVRETAFRSMLVVPQHASASRLVLVRAFDGAYPLYGSLEVTPLQAAQDFPAPGTVLLDETVLRQFNLKPGDPVRLGTHTLCVAGGLTKVPGEAPSSLFVAPRLFMSSADLEATGLLQPGAILDRRLHARLRGDADPEALRKELVGLQLDVQTVETRLKDLVRSAEGIGRFLSWSGLAALILGGIGVAAAAQGYAREQARQVALLRCLGATAAESFLVPLVQIGLLAAAASAMGSLAGSGIARLIQPMLAEAFDVSLPAGFPWSAALEGWAAGTGTGLLFAAGPLSALRKVSPLAGLRAQSALPADRLAWAVAAIAVSIACAAYAGLRAEAIWQGPAFAGALALALALLAGAGWLLRRLARAVARRASSFVVRQAVSNLDRPGNQTLVLVMALGLGVCLLATQQSGSATLLGPLRLAPLATQPDLVLVDVQPDQCEAAHALLSSRGFPVLHDVPIVPMRLSRFRERTVAAWMEDRASRIPDWTLKREYRSTYRDQLVPTETVVEGDWPVPPRADGVVPVSVERDLARDLGIRRGDRVVFDVQGVPVETEIVQIREVDWKSMQPNFFFVFPEGVLESAPRTHAVFTRAETPARSAELQRAVAETMPNLSCLDLASILETVRGVIGKLSAGVRGLSAFTVLAGILVLLGAVHVSRAARRRESLLLRTLGAPESTLLRIAAIEFGSVCLIAAAAGLLLSLPLSAALAYGVFKSPWRVDGLSALVLAVGLLGGGWLIGHLDQRRLIRRTPLAAQRSGSGDR